MHGKMVFGGDGFNLWIKIKYFMSLITILLFVYCKILKRMSN